MPETAISETLSLDAAHVRRTKDGYLLAEPRVARTGIQTYAGAELGIPDKAIVRMMRPENVVFDRESLASYANKPVTMDHPSEFVNADNWRDHAIGQTGGEVLRDGDYIRVPLMLTDRDAIDKVLAGEKVELSLGYTMGYRVEAGDGYDAAVTSIRANHLAVVDRARGGPKLNITGDENVPEKTYTAEIDGMTVNLADQGSVQLIQRHAKDAEAKTADLEKRIVALEAEKAKLGSDVSDRDTKIAALEKAVEDAKMTPEKLDAMIADAAEIREVAKAVLGTAFDAAGKTVAEIKKAVVEHRMGDAAKEYDAAKIGIAYDVLSKDIDISKAPEAKGVVDLSRALARKRNTEDARTEAFNDYKAWLEVGDASKPIGSQA